MPASSALSSDPLHREQREKTGLSSENSKSRLLKMKSRLVSSIVSVMRIDSMSCFRVLP